MEHAQEHVALRAFRGTRRSSVYREHVLSESAFSEILSAGAARGLALLSLLDADGRHELDKVGAKQLAEEATDLRMSGQLPELDDDLTGIAEVARWCAHASEHTWLTIEGQ